MSLITNKIRRRLCQSLLLVMPQVGLASDHDHHDHHSTATVDAHVHGEAKLNIIIDGQQVIAEFMSPLDNLVGFEHEPHTAEQKQAYMALQQTLADYRAIFDITGATCTQIHQQATSPFNRHDSQHVEWHAEYHLQCTGDDRYTLQAPLFNHYPGVETLIVQSITRHGQAEHRLKKDSGDLVLQRNDH